MVFGQVPWLATLLAVVGAVEQSDAVNITSWSDTVISGRRDFDSLVLGNQRPWFLAVVSQKVRCGDVLDFWRGELGACLGGEYYNALFRSVQRKRGRHGPRRRAYCGAW